jgi:hypothetical protein
MSIEKIFFFKIIGFSDDSVHNWGIQKISWKFAIRKLPENLSAFYRKIFPYSTGNFSRKLPEIIDSIFSLLYTVIQGMSCAGTQQKIPSADY